MKRILQYYGLFRLCLKTSIICLLCMMPAKISAQTSIADTSIVIPEVIISAVRPLKASTGMMQGKINLNIKKIKTLPQLFGTVDLIRSLQLMPGVQTANDANAGISIRGSDPGHNLVLLNGAPIYNPIHLFGFFSVFNNEHISDFTLYKNNVSPQYGGRIGGTIDVQSIDTAATRFSGSITLGLIASAGTIAIPTGKHSSLLLSARKTYINYLVDALSVLSEKDNFRMRYDFDDYNASYIYTPCGNNKIIVNFYLGNDRFKLRAREYNIDGKLQWNNIASSIKWAKKYSSTKELTQYIFLSSYYNKTQTIQNKIIIGLPSKITDIGYRMLYRNNSTLLPFKSGADYTYHKLKPQYPYVENSSDFITHHQKNYHTHEIAVFGETSYMLSSWLKATSALRYSILIHRRNFRHNIEPRIQLELYPSTQRKLSLCYALTRQYITQVNVTGLGFPTDFWISASRGIPAQKAHSFSAGYFENIKNGRFEISAEIYYRRFSNQAEFVENLYKMVTTPYRIEERLLIGRGYSFGAELQAKKNFGKLNGWISYCWSQSRRKFPKINYGSGFPAIHDRRHELSIASFYKVSQKVSLSAIFVLATGDAYRLPYEGLDQNGQLIYQTARMPPYNRLDIGMNWNFYKKAYRSADLNISIFNLYSRSNPVFIWIKTYNLPDSQYTLRKYGKALYNLLPSISLSYRF